MSEFQMRARCRTPIEVKASALVTILLLGMMVACSSGQSQGNGKGLDGGGLAAALPGVVPLEAPDEAMLTMPVSSTVNGVEFLDPAGALAGRAVTVKSITREVASTLPAGTIDSWDFGPPGKLDQVAFVRVALTAAQVADTPLVWWTRDEASKRWFVQSVPLLSTDGKTLVVALQHFSSHAVAPAMIHTPPAYADNFGGSCADLVHKLSSGVVDAEGATHTADCGYTTFKPLFSGLQGQDYLDAVQKGLMDPPFKLEYFDGHPTKDSGRLCARVFNVEMNMSAEVAVSFVDWDPQPKTAACNKEWQRLRQVIRQHEGKHVNDARRVIASAQNRSSAISLVECANTQQELDQAIAATTRAALEQLVSSTLDDWNKRVHELDSTTTDRCQMDCGKCGQTCKETGCADGQTCCGKKCIPACTGCESCDEASESCRSTCQGQTSCCGTACVAPCTTCEQCDTERSACVKKQPLPRECSAATKLYCACNKTCYDDVQTCLGQCHTSLGCFTGICGPATAEQCPTPP